MAELVETDSHSIDAVAFRKTLIAWGRKHFRRLPWRLTRNPYRILMAEVMLHRTQAPQVVAVYEQFIERYPDIPALAQATKKELDDVLYSLGLRWRVDLVHKMATRLVEGSRGRIPRRKEGLLSLPGISDYIASAVRCFSWNLPEPLIDTNTVRVVGRLFGLEIKDSSRRNQRFRGLLTALVDPDEARAYNYALLDLADRICMKKRPPDCERCPILRWCSYGSLSLCRGERASVSQGGSGLKADESHAELVYPLKEA